jgi:hypothetical protein
MAMPDGFAILQYTVMTEPPITAISLTLPFRFIAMMPFHYSYRAETESTLNYSLSFRFSSITPLLSCRFSHFFISALA